MKAKKCPCCREKPEIYFIKPFTWAECICGRCTAFIDGGKFAERKEDEAIFLWNENVKEYKRSERAAKKKIRGKKRNAVSGKNIKR